MYSEYFEVLVFGGNNFIFVLDNVGYYYYDYVNIIFVCLVMKEFMGI